MERAQARQAAALIAAQVRQVQTRQVLQPLALRVLQAHPAAQALPVVPAPLVTRLSLLHRIIH